MAVVEFDSVSLSPAGNSAATATQIERLGNITVVLSSNGIGSTVNSVIGYALPLSPNEGDLVEIYSTDFTYFLLYAGVIPINGSPNNATGQGEMLAVRARYVGTAGWFTMHSNF
jgi:hypothetical protein